MNKEWIPVFGKMTYGIYVLTTFYEDRINGMIASWVSQVSYDPPLVMAAVHPNRYTHDLIEKSGFFAIHIISKDRKDFMSRFKGPDPLEKFSKIDWARGQTGCPVITESIACMECAVRERHEPGNHTLFIGEAVNTRIFIENETSLTTLDYDRVYLGQS